VDQSGSIAELSSCLGPRVVHTIGHSNRRLDEFLDMLESHAIAFLVDIRRWPSSRKFPHFNKDSLSTALEQRGIEYEWIEQLGGYRKPSPNSPNTGWKVGSFRAYADFMQTQEFERALARIENKAKDKRTVLMCAEALPYRCHRRLLSDAFVVRGWQVRHIRGRDCEIHCLPAFARVEGKKRISYPGEAKLF